MLVFVLMEFRSYIFFLQGNKVFNGLKAGDRACAYILYDKNLGNGLIFE